MSTTWEAVLQAQGCLAADRRRDAERREGRVEPCGVGFGFGFGCWVVGLLLEGWEEESRWGGCGLMAILDIGADAVR